MEDGRAFLFYTTGTGMFNHRKSLQQYPFSVFSIFVFRLSKWIVLYVPLCLHQVYAIAIKLGCINLNPCMICRFSDVGFQIVLLLELWEYNRYLVLLVFLFILGLLLPQISNSVPVRSASTRLLKDESNITHYGCKL